MVVRDNLVPWRLRVLLAALVLMSFGACATTPSADPAAEDFESLTDEEVRALDCRLLEAGHFRFEVQPGYDFRRLERRIESLGFDVIRNRRTLWRTEVGPNGVHRDVPEAVEGDGYRYADPMCKFRSQRIKR